MRAPREAEIPANLRDADRAFQGPEVRISKRNVDGLQLDCMRELALVRSHHVGCGRQPRGAAKFSKDLAAGIPLLGAARIFRVGEDVLFAGTKSDRLLQ